VGTTLTATGRDAKILGCLWMEDSIFIGFSVCIVMLRKAGLEMHPVGVGFALATASLVPACFARLCPLGIFEAQKHGQLQDNRMLEG